MRNLTLDDFLWGYCISMSRLFGAPNDSSVAIPNAVLFNHSPQPNSYWNFNEVENFWYFFTYETIEIGQDVTISYGDKENIELMWAYGFMTNDNPSEKGYFLRPLAIDGDPVRQTIVNTIIPQYLDWSEFDRAWGISEHEMKLIRILLLDRNQFDSYHISKIIDGATFNEDKVISSIEKECQLQFQQIPGTDKTDKEFLERTKKHFLPSALTPTAQNYWISNLMLIEYRIDRREFFNDWCLKTPERICNDF